MKYFLINFCFLCLLLAVFLLVACNNIPVTPRRSSTTSPTVAPSAALASSTPSAFASLTPTPNQPSILDVFPLRVGAAWVYDVTVDYDDNNAALRWTGTVTETIVDATENGPAWIFSSAMTEPRPPYSGIWKQTHNYVAIGNRIFELAPWERIEPFVGTSVQGSWSQIIVWPLQVGQRWGPPEFLARPDDYYVWRVEEEQAITTPAGIFTACYHLQFLTSPDDLHLWFCPMIGIARREYHHHGTRLDEFWQLQTWR